MQYTSEDMQIVEQQKQYIDTVLVPVISVAFDEQTVRTQAAAAQFITAVAQFTEVQLRGRILLVPAITAPNATLAAQLVTPIVEQLQAAGYRHIVLLTAQPKWLEEVELPKVWLPAIPLDAMEPSVKAKIIEEQFKQVLPILTDLWSSKQLSNL